MQVIGKDDAGLGLKMKKGKHQAPIWMVSSAEGQEGPQVQQLVFGMSVGKKQQWESQLSTPSDC